MLWGMIAPPHLEDMFTGQQNKILAAQQHIQFPSNVLGCSQEQFESMINGLGTLDHFAKHMLLYLHGDDNQFALQDELDHQLDHLQKKVFANPTALLFVCDDHRVRANDLYDQKTTIEINQILDGCMNYLIERKREKQLKNAYFDKFTDVLLCAISMPNPLSVFNKFHLGYFQCKNDGYSTQLKQSNLKKRMLADLELSDESLCFMPYQDTLIKMLDTAQTGRWNMGVFPTPETTGLAYTSAWTCGIYYQQINEQDLTSGLETLNIAAIKEGKHYTLVILPYQHYLLLTLLHTINQPETSEPLRNELFKKALLIAQNLPTVPEQFIKKCQAEGFSEDALLFETKNKTYYQTIILPILHTAALRHNQEEIKRWGSFFGTFSQNSPDISLKFFDEESRTFSTIQTQLHLAIRTCFQSLNAETAKEALHRVQNVIQKQTLQSDSLHAQSVSAPYQP